MLPHTLAARGRAVIAVCALVSSSLSPLTARAADERATAAPSIDRAEARAAQAFQAYERKDYARAVALYLEAYEAAPSADMLYNIARIYDTKLGDRQLAMTFYRRYIADPGAVADRIKLANERLVALREAELVAKASESEPTGSGSAPKAAFSGTTDDAPAPQWSTLRWVGVGTGAAGIVAVGIGSVFGLRAMRDGGTANDLCDGNACSSQRGLDAAESASSAATVANIGLITGAVLIGTGATLFVIGGNDEPEQRRRGNVAIGGSASPSHVSVGLNGRF